MVNYTTVTSDKSKNTAAILCCLGFLGIGGLHHFYVGRIGMGLLHLFTMGLFMIGTFVDLIKILMGGFRDNVGAPLRQSKPRRPASLHQVNPPPATVRSPSAAPALPTKTYNHERSLEKGCAALPAIPDGYELKYDYDDVRVAVSKNENRVGIGSVVRFKHEPHNQYDDNAVAIYVEDFKIGYLYRGKLQDMWHDFTRRGDTVIGCVQAFYYDKEDDFDSFSLLVGFCIKI